MGWFICQSLMLQKLEKIGSAPWIVEDQRSEIRWAAAGEKLMVLDISPKTSKFASLTTYHSEHDISTVSVKHLWSNTLLQSPNRKEPYIEQ